MLLILAFAVGLASSLVDARIPMAPTRGTQAPIEQRWLLLLALTVLLLVAGAMMDIFSAIALLVPLLQPLALAYDGHPVHRGILFVANVELGHLTPPTRTAAGAGPPRRRPDAAHPRRRRATDHLYPAAHPGHPGARPRRVNGATAPGWRPGGAAQDRSGGDESEPALNRAAAPARTTGAQVTVVTVVERPDLTPTPHVLP